MGHLIKLLSHIKHRRIMRDNGVDEDMRHFRAIGRFLLFGIKWKWKCHIYTVTPRGRNVNLTQLRVVSRCFICEKEKYRVFKGDSSALYSAQHALHYMCSSLVQNMSL